ncbi:MAG: hypothetical protein HY758_02525 [Nitrospirae bacterium]|nr:hypothetical protein [Nitrospirota bacterium]
MNFMRSHKMNLTVIILIITVIATGLLVYKHVISVKNRQDYVRVADTLRKAVLEIKKNEKNFLLQKSEERYKHLQASTYALSNTLDKIPLKTMMEISEEDFLTLRRSIHEYSQLSVGLLQRIFLRSGG